MKRARLAVLVLVASAMTGCRDQKSSPVPMKVPAEVADAEALAELRDWRGLPVFGAGRYRMQSSEDRKMGWQPPIALWRNDNRDFNNFVCRGERTVAPPADVPHFTDLDACPESYVRGMVMARFEGSGRLARLWLTAASIRQHAPDEEVLRVYVDDELAIQAPLSEMLAGGGDAIFAAPFGAGSRRYLSWHYPVVFSKRLILSLDHLGSHDLYFHQTSVVLDETPRARTSPGVELHERELARRALRSGVPASAPAHRKSLALEPHGKASIRFEGPATIVQTTLVLSSPASANVRVRVFWDGAERPAIDARLTDLFAIWSKLPERPSLALAATDEKVSLRLPMPFAESARWDFENDQGEPASFTLTHEVASGVPESAHGHLHAQVHTTEGDVDGGYHPLAQVDGRGRLVGTCMSMRGHGLVERGRTGHPFHFLEGDEVGVIDGERVLGGTGTEDYFDGAFYFEDGASGTPFAQVWDITPAIPASPEQGRVSACRWHVAGDEIDFRRSLDLKLEIGPGVADVLDAYRSVTFVYR